jgi:hypothetical protein
VLTSSAKSISDFSSAAGDVRLQIATIRIGQADPVTAIERQGLTTIRDLIDLGHRFYPDPGGNLDVTGSTPEEIDLAGELKRLLPGRLESVQSKAGGPDVRRWSEIASGVLTRFEEATGWQQLQASEREFVESELEPFLVKLIEEPVQDEEE